MSGFEVAALALVLKAENNSVQVRMQIKSRLVIDVPSIFDGCALSGLHSQPLMKRIGGFSRLMRLSAKIQRTLAPGFADMSTDVERTNRRTVGQDSRVALLRRSAEKPVIDGGRQPRPPGLEPRGIVGRWVFEGRGMEHDGVHAQRQ